MSENVPTPRLNLRPSLEILDYLDDLVEVGIYGKRRSEVALSLLSREIERLLTSGMINMRSKTTKTK